MLTAVAFTAPQAKFWSMSGTAGMLGTSNKEHKRVVKITSTPNAAEFYGVTGGSVNFTPKESLYFQDIYLLSTDWKAMTDWGGGSPRFCIGIDCNDDGRFTSGTDKWVFVYLLTAFPSFYGGPHDWINSGNLINATQGIWDTTQLGGASGYGNYGSALQLLAGKRVLKVMVVVDGGWIHGWDSTFIQSAYFDNIKVNGNYYPDWQ